MAELFVPKIIHELGDVVVNQLGEKINLVMGVEEEVANIKRKLETIQNVLHDAERRRQSEKPVAKWLEELEDITYEMDDVLDEWNIKIQKPKYEGTHQKQPTLRNKRIMTTSIIDESGIYGRESDKDALLDQVLSETSSSQGRDGVQIISVVGAGDPFDQKRIAKAILENAGRGSHFMLELDSLIRLIKETFFGKRFLLVLDDVWTEDDSKWKHFQDSLKDGASGSVILVTTRSHRVATMVGTTHTHQMTRMSDSDCWLIMQRIAFARKSGDLCKKVERIGLKIAEKSKGLPLAAKTMGSLLRFKDTIQQWQNILDSEIWQLNEAAVRLFPHLYLSYNELPPELKRCFSYCAAFPKDFEINVEKLIRLWIAQGYVRPNRRGERLELVGLEYFNNLAMCSFFQELQEVEGYYGFHEYMKCKMHDIFNARSNSDDLAILKYLNQLEKLRVDIYGEIKIRALSKQQGLWSLLTKKKSDSVDEESMSLEEKAHSTIMLFLTDDVITEVAGEETATGLWVKLESLYMTKSLTNKLLLKQRLFGLRMQEGTPLQEHLDQLNTILLELRNIDVKIEDEDTALILLVSLSLSYENFVQSFIGGKDTVTLEEVRPALHSRELRHKAADNVTDNQAAGLVVSSGKGKLGKKKSENKKQFFKGPKPDDVFAEKEAKNSEENLALIANEPTHHSDVWVLDSGASYHICPNREWFTTYEQIDGGNVMMANSAVCKAVGIGSIKIRTHVEKIAILNEVRHVPKMTKNLISLSTLDSKGFRFSGGSGELCISKGSLVVLKGVKHGTLYILQGSPITGSAAAAVASSEDRRSV
nr:disease resistance protein RGA2-like [Coffea arabica]